MSVVHCKSGKPFDVYVGRPTFWGNLWTHKKGTTAQFVVNTQQEAVDCFRDWLAGARFGDVEPRKRAAILNSIHTLKGKTLSCWCGEGEPCHAIVLEEMANK